MKIWEVWKAKDGSESACFLSSKCTEQQYRLLTHTVDDVPMEFVASFYELSTRVAFDTVPGVLYED